jgi:hypothetical protein
MQHGNLYKKSGSYARSFMKTKPFNKDLKKRPVIYDFQGKTKKENKKEKEIVLVGYPPKGDWTGRIKNSGNEFRFTIPPVAGE